MKEKYVKLSDVIAMLGSDIKITNDDKSKIEGNDISAQIRKAVCDILAKHTSVLMMAVMNHLKTYEFEDGKK